MEEIIKYIAIMMFITFLTLMFMGKRFITIIFSLIIILLGFLTIVFSIRIIGGFEGMAVGFIGLMTAALGLLLYLVGLFYFLIKGK
ncbi:YesK family protein [Thermaerobacillus caldiproteolyticus]|uniref:YesK-like protein n=1 Tax=Thermaerobacillus caldiproteolyticus TaxID=247480 RepID=A0A7V9Z7G6_9BACL|nr:YesK family protein [Anoxybacillus caldiproteolyticus]MBA2875449.1 hypothetical protein [Anoxybacillus caldiproteolyticus]